jgi:hypothetical protein
MGGRGTDLLQQHQEPQPLLELRDDPHVGADVEVMRPTITPDVVCVDATEAVVRHDVLPEASNKVDVVWNPLVADIVTQ